MNRTKHFLLSLLALVAFATGARAEGETAYAVWVEANKTLYFTNRAETLAAGGTFTPYGATEPVTIKSVWSGTDVTASAVYSPGWETWGVYNNISTVVFEPSFASVLPTSTNYWFNNCSNLTTITGISYLNTSEVTNMGYMFYKCSKLTSLDLSSFNTAKVTDMSNMFSSCSELKTLNLSGWTNTKATNMSSMLYNCQKLETLTLTNFATPAATSMSSMFSNCKALASLDLSSFNTASVTAMSSMFNGCTNLQSITLGSNFSTANVTSMSSMFNGCGNLQAVDVSGFNTAKVTTMANMFKGCSNLTSLDISSFSSAGMPTSGSDNGFLYCMFQDCSNLETITLGSNLCTNKVKSVQSMFQGCAKLKNIDTSMLNLSNASYLTHLFDGCSSLTSIDLSGTTFVSNVSNLSLDYMFNGCSNLASLKLPASSVKAGSIKYMFAGCSSLESITLPVIEIDITREWGVAVDYLFSGCSSAKNINLNGLDVRYTYNLQNMFEGCSALQSIDLSGFDTKNVTNMSCMFKGCSTLTTLDLSTFNTANVTNMSEMFSGCSQMESIYVSCAWTAYNATSSSNMFKDCTSLVGQDGTALASYSPQSLDRTHATDEEGGYMKTGTDTPVEPTAYAIWVDEDTPFYFLQSTKQLVPGRLFTPEGSSTPLRMAKVWCGWRVSGTQGNQQWSAINSKIKSVVFEPSFANVKPNTLARWFENCKNLTTLTGLEYVNPSGTVKSAGSMFSGCTSLESIDLSSLNMNSFTRTEYMFKGCTKLTSVTGIKTPNVESMEYMFQSCTALEDLDLSSFNTAKVTYMQYMFDGCTKLKNLNVKGFNTSLVTNMSYMFRNCSSLETLDLTSFNTAKLASTNYMFNGCSQLVSIYVFAGTWDIKDKISQWSSTQMFTGCTSIVGQDATTYNSSNVTAAYAHAGTGGYLRAAELPLAIWCNSNTTLYFVKTSDAVGVGKTFMPEGSSTGVTVTNIWVGDEVENTLVRRDALFKTPYWNSYQYSVRDNATRVVFESTFADVKPNCTSGWFQQFENLTAVDGLNYLNTSEVTDMSSMFYNCRKVTALNVSGFNTDKVTDMSQLFYGCETLGTLTGLNQFNTVNVTNMHGMFGYCWALPTIDVSSFDTKNVTDMGDMFGRCVGLTSLDVSHFDTSKVTDMSSMFQSIRLSSIDISSFDTQNVTDMRCMFWLSHVEHVNMSGLNTGKVTTMYQMFYECPNLKSVDMGGCNTSSLTDVRAMFSDCPNLERVDLSGWTNEQLTSLPWLFDGDEKLKEVILTDFKTDNMVNLMRAFYHCSSLTNLDLSSFNTSKVINMYGLFIGCTGLKSVIIGDDWTTANLQESVYIGTGFVNGKGDIFKNCTSIVGEDGTAFDASYIDATKAHNGTGGYLRMKHDSWTVTVPASGIATFSADRNVTIPDGLTAYTCTNYSNGFINATQLSGTIIPAETGVLLKGEAGETFTLAATTGKASAVSGNALVAVTAPTHVAPTDGDTYTNFLLKSGAFVRIAESSNSMPANKAYLQIATADLNANARIALRWDDGSVTGISTVLPNGADAGTIYYDLQGRRVERSHRGLVIERTANGTRTVVK
jgi:surface protein